MKKISLQKILISFLVGCLGVPLGMFADTTTGSVVSFSVTTSSNTAVVNQAIDITVQALDKNGNVVPSYRGSIIFVPDNMGDTVPMQGKGIAFTAEDSGVKKFSKGIIFKSPGDQKVYVTDVSDDISGEATVKVSADTSATTTDTGTSADVTILTPQNNSQVTPGVLLVSGQTKKNTKVDITLNGQDMGTTIADDSGLFTKSLSGGTQGNNILSVSLIAADGSVIGKSPDTNFQVTNNAPNFNSLVITSSGSLYSSSGEVYPGDPITLTIEADPGMANVSVGIDGSQIQAQATSDTKTYAVTTPAPAKSGTYPLDVTITDSLGQTTAKKGAGTIIVVDKPAPVIAPPLITTTQNPTFQNVKISTSGSRATLEFGVLNGTSDIDKFKIVYGDSPDSLTNEAITYSSGKILEKDGSTYTWYIDKLQPKTYYFKVFGMKADGSLMNNFASDAQSVTVGGGSCSIGDVGDVTVSTQANKSVLSWQSVTGAVSYNIYKVSAAGDYTLFQNTTDTQYALFLSSGAVVNENFAIKALCDDKTVSPDYKQVSKVQTGPGYLAVLVAISAILGAIILRKKIA